MEDVAQQYVLENIKAAIYNKKRLAQELRGYDHVPTLREFVENNGQDVRIIYKSNSCWTSLKRDAGKCVYEDDAYTFRFERGLSNLVHANSVAYLHFIKHLLSTSKPITFHDEREKTFAVMFYYTLYIDKISKTGFHTLEEAIGKFREYPLFVSEINELVDFLLANIENITFPVGEGLPVTLEQYGLYTREEVFAIFGRQTAERKMQGSVSGVFNILSM